MFGHTPPAVKKIMQEYFRREELLRQYFMKGAKR